LVLPDVLASDLRVVFCGAAAGTASARRGAYYVGPGNKFWATLHEIGPTPRRLAPFEFASVLDHGIGLTDLCKLRGGADAAIGRDAFDVAGLTARMAKHSPAFLVFNSIKGRPRDAGGGRRLWPADTPRDGDGLAVQAMNRSGHQSVNEQFVSRGAKSTLCPERSIHV
jgi:TDG/mug DNA glycosylase family protein